MPVQTAVETFRGWKSSPIDVSMAILERQGKVLFTIEVSADFEPDSVSVLFINDDSNVWRKKK